MTEQDELFKQLDERQRQGERFKSMLNQLATIVFSYALPLAVIVFIILLQNPNVGRDVSDTFSAFLAPRPALGPEIQVATPAPSPTIVANVSTATPIAYFPEISATPTPTPGATLSPTAASQTPTPTPKCQDAVNISETFKKFCSEQNGTIKTPSDERGCPLPPVCATPTPTPVPTATASPTPTPEPEIQNTTSWVTEKQNYNRTGGSSSRLPKYSIRKAWEFKTGGAIHSSPAVAYGRVFFGSDDGTVYALNKTTGEKIWSYNTSFKVRGSPVTDGDQVIVGDGKGVIHSFKAETGNLSWQFNATGAVRASPTIFDSKVYFGTDNYHLYGLHAPNGTKIFDNFVDEDIRSSPIAWTNNLCTYSESLVFRCLERSNGSALWVNASHQMKFTTDNGTVTRDGKTSPVMFVIYDGGVPVRNYYFLGAYDGQLYELDDYLKVRWQYQTGAAIHGAPAAVESRLYAANIDGKVFGFNVSQVFNVTFWNRTIDPPAIINSTTARNTTLLWQKLLPTKVEAPVSATSEVIYVAGVDGVLYALHPDSGTVLSNFSTNGAIFSAPAIADGFVFVTSTDGKIYALSRP